MPFQSKQGFYTSGNLNYHAGYKPTATDIGVATTAQAVAGSDNTMIMTPLRVKEYVAGLGLSSTGHNHDSSYLKLTGGTLTGDLTLQKNLPVFTINNSSGTDVAINLNRNDNADWKVLATAGNLHFQTNWTSSKGAFYDVLKLNYNSGNMTVKGTITEAGTTLANKYAAKTHAHAYNDLTAKPIYLGSGASASASAASWAGMSADISALPVAMGSTFTGGDAKIAFSSSSGKMHLAVDGEFYANEGKYKVYHGGNKPTLAELGAAAASHGNHVPATQTANNAVFLRNDNSWQTVTPANIGAAATSHNHDHRSVSGMGSIESNLVRVYNPAGGVYGTQTNSVTGAIKITLPTSWVSAMMRFKVHVYDYRQNRSFTVLISGYNYNHTTSAWHQVSAEIISSSTSSNYNIRFGHDGTKCCVLIGEVGSTWSYPQVAVTEFMAGFTGANGVARWDRGWNISFVTTLPSQIDHTISPTIVSDWNKMLNKPTLLTIDDTSTSLTTKTWSAKKINDTITAQINSLINSAPGALDTLKELADALGNDANFATTVNNKLALKAEKTYVDTELAKKANTHDHPYAPTSHTYSYLPLSGGTLSGDITFNTSTTGIKWTMNTDGAGINFKNTGDSDSDSYLEFYTMDNSNEFFKWVHKATSSTTEWMTLKSDGLRIKGNLVYHAGNKPTAADVGAAPTSHTHSEYSVTSHNHSDRLRVQKTTGTSMNADTVCTDDVLMTSTAGLIAGTLFPGADNARGVLNVNTHPTYNTQLGFSTTHNKLYIRSKAASADWTSWQEIYHAGSKPTPAAIGAATSDHTHSNYSLTTHTHDYAAAGHNHDTAYQKKESTTFGLNGNYVAVRTPGRTTSQYYEFWDSNVGWATIKAQEFYAGDGQHKVYHPGNKPTAADIGASPAHSHPYLNLSGGTMTGPVTFPGSYNYFDASSRFAINLTNSSIIGINTLVFADESDAVEEGICWPKAGKTGSVNKADYDILRSYQSFLYYNTYKVYHEGYKPTPANIGAATSDHLHDSRYIRKDIDDTLAVNRRIQFGNANTYIIKNTNGGFYVANRDGAAGHIYLETNGGNLMHRNGSTDYNVWSARNFDPATKLNTSGGTITGNIALTSSTAKIQLGTSASSYIGVENTYDVVIKTVSDIILHAETDANLTAEFVQLKAGNAGSNGLKVFTDKIEAHEKIVAKKQIDMGSSSQAGIKYNETTECIEFYFA